jgi:hypothetical protein
MKLYVINRTDWLAATSKGQIPEGCLISMGSLWCYVRFTPEQRNSYSYGICEA